MVSISVLPTKTHFSYQRAICPSHLTLPDLIDFINYVLPGIMFCGSGLFACHRHSHRQRFQFLFLAHARVSSAQLFVVLSLLAHLTAGPADSNHIAVFFCVVHSLKIVGLCGCVAEIGIT